MLNTGKPKRDPFKKLFSNMSNSGGRSARATQRVVNYHPVTVTVNDLKHKFAEQNSCCYWTKMPIDMHRVFNSYDMEMPSVDRLDNDRGYEYDNIVITLRFINVGRGRMGVAETAEFIKRLMGTETSK